MTVLRPRRRSLVGLTVSLLVLAGCGDDGDADPTPDGTTSITAPTTAPTGDTTAPVPTTVAPDGTPTTAAPTSTEAAPTVEGTLVTGSVTNAGGVEAAWTLTAAPGELCFGADLSHDDPGIAETLGSGVDECLRPVEGLGELDDALSVSVGVVDGERSFGYLWGRVDHTIISLTIEHTDGTQTALELVPGPESTQVFAVVVDIDAIPPVESLDAVSGTQLEHSELIRDFLRAGPTYPTTPTSTVPHDDQYPVVN